jgi:hypothetical protein
MISVSAGSLRTPKVPPTLMRQTDTKEANSVPTETEFWGYVGTEYQILLQDTVLHKNHPTIYLLT